MFLREKGWTIQDALTQSSCKDHVSRHRELSTHGPKLDKLNRKSSWEGDGRWDSIFLLLTSVILNNPSLTVTTPATVSSL